MFLLKARRPEKYREHSRTYADTRASFANL
jgi:hypothetical protein